MRSRQEITLEEYTKTINIEARTMIDMLRKDIIPACIKYGRELSDTAISKKSIGIDAASEIALAQALSDETAKLIAAESALEAVLATVPSEDSAMYMHDSVIPAMDAARASADKLEMMVPKTIWPMPTYGDILFYV